MSAYGQYVVGNRDCDIGVWGDGTAYHVAPHLGSITANGIQLSFTDTGTGEKDFEVLRTEIVDGILTGKGEGGRGAPGGWLRGYFYHTAPRARASPHSLSLFLSLFLSLSHSLLATTTTPPRSVSQPPAL